MPTLPTTGTISYQSSLGNVTWDATARTRFRSKPVLDKAGRTVKYNEVTLEVSGFITATPGIGSATDSEFTSWRQTLGESGGILIWTSHGYGNFLQVNGASPAPNQLPLASDCLWGPVCSGIEARVAGDNQALFVTVTFTAHLSEYHNKEALGLKDLVGRIVSFNYSMDFDILENGLQKVTYTAEAEVAQSRRIPGDRSLRIVADKLLENITPPVIDGFRRTSHRHIDESKNCISVTVSDEQTPVPLPPGCVRAPIRHKVRGDLRTGFSVWDCSVSGTLQLGAGQKKADAFRLAVVIILAKIRTKAFGSTFSNPQRPPVPNQKPPQTMLLLSVEFTDIVDDIALDFAASYKVLGASLEDIVGQSAFLQPLPGTSFRLWSQSLQLEQSPRGIAGLALRPQDDAILDLGDNVQPTVPKLVANNLNTLRPGGGANRALRDLVDEEHSWVWWENNLTYTEEGGTATHVPVGVLSGLAQFAAGNPVGGVQSLINATGNALSAFRQAAIWTFQNTTQPRPKVRMVGWAARIAHPIEMPKVKQIGPYVVGLDPGNARQINPIIKNGKWGRVGPLVVNVLSWDVEFWLPGPIQQNLSASNVILDTPGTPNFKDGAP